VRSLLTGAAQELAQTRVTVAHAAGTKAAPAVSVGPPKTTAAGLRIALAASLMANVMLATVLLGILKRRPRPRRFY
jgi:hypothetical protein